MSHAELKQIVLIDTNVWIGFFSKTGYLPTKEQLNKLLGLHAVAIAGPIVLELLQGCRSAKERRTVRDYFEGLHWFVTEDKHWFQAGEMANDLRQRGMRRSVRWMLLLQPWISPIPVN